MSDTENTLENGQNKKVINVDPNSVITPETSLDSEALQNETNALVQQAKAEQNTNNQENTTLTVSPTANSEQPELHADDLDLITDRLLQKQNAIIREMFEKQTENNVICLQSMFKEQITAIKEYLSSIRKDSNENTKNIQRSIKSRLEPVETKIDDNTNALDSISSTVNDIRGSLTQNSQSLHLQSTPQKSNGSISSRLFDNSIEAERGNLERTPVKTGQLQKPDGPSNNTRKQKAEQDNQLNGKDSNQQTGDVPMKEDNNQNNLNQNFGYQPFNGQYNPPFNGNQGYGQIFPNFQNGSDQPKEDFREAVKTRRHLCTQQPSEKFDAIKTSIGYFIRRKILSIANINNLTRICDVAPWIHLHFGDTYYDRIQREIQRSKRNLSENELDKFLLRLARYLSPIGDGVSSDAKSRKDHEKLEDYVERQIVEYDSVIEFEEDIDEEKDFRIISRSIYRYMKSNEAQDLLQVMSNCVQNNMLEPIDSKTKLMRLARQVDKTYVGNLAAKEQISAFSSQRFNSANRQQNQQIQPQRSSNASLYPNPPISSQQSVKACDCCGTHFTPGRPTDKLCKKCYVYVRQKLKSKSRRQFSSADVDQSEIESSDSDEQEPELCVMSFCPTGQEPILDCMDFEQPTCIASAFKEKLPRVSPFQEFKPR